MNALAIVTVGGTCESDNVKIEFFQPILNSGSCRILVLPLDVGEVEETQVLCYQNTAGLGERRSSPSTYGKAKKKPTNASSLLEDRQVALVTVTGFLRKNNGQWLINYSWKY